MKLISFALVSLTIILPQVVNAKPLVEADASLERYQQLLKKSLLLEPCVEALRDDLRPLVQDFGEWVLDVLIRLNSIIEIRRTCDSIEMSDPPTPWELIQRQACEVVFQATVAMEIIRLTYEINQKLQSYPVIVRESIERFLECVDYEVPEIPEFKDLQLRPSLHRD